MLDAFMRVMGMAGDVGLHLNPRKSELAALEAESKEDRVAALETFAAIAPGIVDLQARDTTLLGSPITLSALEAMLKKKTETLRNSFSRLQQLTAPWSQWGVPEMMGNGQTG